MIAERTKEIMEAQRQRFREKFGRDWREDDPVFFDPDASEPRPMSGVKAARTRRRSRLDSAVAKLAHRP
jgi:hypothetical protein